MKTQILFIAFLSICNLAISQDREAKIILKDNSTLQGFGEIKKDKIYFKSKLDAKPKILTEADAKGIEFTGYRLPEKYIYVFHGKRNEAHLMEAIEQGFVELYKDTYYLAQNSPIPGNTSVINSKIIEFYIKKPNESRGTLITMDFKKIGQKFFSDCEDLMSMINEEEFLEEEEIIDLVKFYNRSCGK